MYHKIYLNSSQNHEANGMLHICTPFITQRLLGSCVVKASAVKCQSLFSIQHCDQYLINILIDTWSTLDEHYINSRSIDGQASRDSLKSIKKDVNGVSTKVPWSVDQV